MKMWKIVGSVHSGDDKSHSYKSRVEERPEPFSQNLKRRSNLSPDLNRSFCSGYFEKRRHNTLNMTVLSNKSEKDIKGYSSRNDLFTEMRNRGNRQDDGSRVGSRMDSLNNAQTQKGSKGRSIVIKQANSRIHQLKKQTVKLKKTLETEFNNFKNFFYQMEQKLHEAQENKDFETSSATKVDEDFLKDILGEAMEVERFFGEMDRKKAVIMQGLAI